MTTICSMRRNEVLIKRTPHHLVCPEHHPSCLARTRIAVHDRPRRPLRHFSNGDSLPYGGCVLTSSWTGERSHSVETLSSREAFEATPSGKGELPGGMATAEAWPAGNFGMFCQISLATNHRSVPAIRPFPRFWPRFADLTALAGFPSVSPHDLVCVHDQRATPAVTARIPLQCSALLHHPAAGGGWRFSLPPGVAIVFPRHVRAVIHKRRTQTCCVMRNREG
jgi:hypothetical protein